MRTLRSLLLVALLGATTSACGTIAAPTRPASETVRLTFTTPADLDGWIATDGRWRVEDGVLIGTAPADGTYPYLTFARHFAEIEEVHVVGGLAAGSAHNFRMAVGPAAAIFNWESKAISIFRTGAISGTSSDALLVPGEDHEIIFRQEGSGWRLLLDDRIVHEEMGLLHGTVTLYPMLGSTIRVKEFAITGRPLPSIEVHGPSSPPN